MAGKPQNPQKYSNLLQTNLQSNSNQVRIKVGPRLQKGNCVIQKIRRKSLQLKAFGSYIVSQNEIPQLQTKKTNVAMNQQIIKKLLLQPKFDKESENQKLKRKSLYVIRKRQEKSKIQKQKQVFKAQESYLFKCQNLSIRSTTEPIQQPMQKKSLFKIRRKEFKLFGTDQLDQANSPAKQDGNKKKYGKVIKKIFNCTSYNNFSNSSFYINSKIKQEVKGNQKIQNQGLIPAVRIILPNRVKKQAKNQTFLLNRNTKQRFFNVPTSKLGFIRSKTEQISTNDLTGWQYNFAQQNEEEYNI